MKSLPMLMLQEAPNMGFFVFDEFYRYYLMRGPLHNTRGFTPEESEGKTLYEILPKETWAQLEKWYDRALDGETFETKYTSPMNSETYHVYFFPIEFNGKKFGAGAVRDITSVLSAERLLVDDKHKDYLSRLIGSYHSKVSEILIDLSECKSIPEHCRKKAREAFKLTNGLQKVAGNIHYDFETFKIDEAVLEAHKRSGSDLNLALNGALIKAERHSLIHALVELFDSIKSVGYVVTVKNEILIKFEPPENTLSFGFEVAQAVLRGHGVSFERSTSGKFIIWNLKGFNYA